jgi:hypothetical protein
LICSVIALHSLIGNKFTFRDAEKKKDSCCHLTKCPKLLLPDWLFYFVSVISVLDTSFFPSLGFYMPRNHSKMFLSIITQLSKANEAQGSCTNQFYRNQSAFYLRIRFF